MKYIMALVLPLLLVPVTQMTHAKIELDCPKGTFLTSNLQCNPYPPHKQPIYQNQTWLGNQTKKIMAKIDSGIAGILNGIICMSTGNANKTECK